MPEIRDAFRFNNFTVDGVFMNETCKFMVFDWMEDDNREYYAFDINTRTISSLGFYVRKNQGPELSHQDGNGLLLVKF